MLPLVVLLPSALLGAQVWTDVRDALVAVGVRVRLADTGTGSETGVTASEVAGAYLAAVPDDEPVLLVPHSNAGLYVPQIIAARDVTGCVFVDASLPPAQGHVVSATGRRREHLAGLADATGTLPPWTRWWDEEDLAELFPDDGVRARVEAGQQALPLAYFDAEISVPAGWTATPCAYLAFGGTYAGEVAIAAERGWPVRTLNGGHLHVLAAPAEVARAVTDLAASFGQAPG